ncbi:MAG: oligoendopeptidase, partial [Candidatus Dormibacteraeota bacterium]|nr:oligoendopeptidase [Candidatus Dormibacteraeota bacterium]
MAAAIVSTTGAEQIHWNLGDLYEGDQAAAVEADLARADGLAEEFASATRGRVGELDAAGMVAAIQRMEEIDEIQGRASTYAVLNFTTDMADAARGALLQKVREALTQTATKLVFFSLEWLAVPEEAADRLLADPALANYRYHLQSARRYRPHVLSEPEEKVIVEKSLTARSAWDRLFDELAAAVRVTLDGREKSLEEALAAMHTADPEARRAVAEAITAG